MVKPTTRRYEKRKRADAEAATRQRIVEATVELHRTVGPARTTISEVAKRAGVQRPTVYNHFPDDGSLFAACGAHWQAGHPPPDPAAWMAIGDPDARLRAALEAIYAYYRWTADMTGNVLRDAPLLPALQPAVEHGYEAFVGAVRDALAGGWPVRGARREALRSALGVALDFHTWQRLDRDGLDDEAAARLMARGAGSAAAGGPTPARRGPRPGGRGP